jgi:heme exporter protein A
MKLIGNALTSERNGRIVFSDLNFAVAAGELAELRGPNGSGKSTLLRLIAGLVPVISGRLVLDGLGGCIPQLCHFIGHQDALKNVMSVRESLAFWVDMLGGGDRQGDALHLFNLFAIADQPVQLLSAGQRRRLALARLAAVARPIWLLDEPMTALDASSQSILLDVIAQHRATGGIVIAATHGDLPIGPDHLITLGAAP